MSRHLSSLMNSPEPKTPAELRSILGTYHAPCPKCGLGIAGVQDDGTLICFGCREDLFDDPRFAFRVQLVTTPDCPDGMFLVIDHDEEIARIERDPTGEQAQLRPIRVGHILVSLDTGEWDAAAPLQYHRSAWGLLDRPPKQPTKGD